MSFFPQGRKSSKETDRTRGVEYVWLGMSWYGPFLYHSRTYTWMIGSFLGLCETCSMLAAWQTANQQESLGSAWVPRWVIAQRCMAGNEDEAFPAVLHHLFFWIDRGVLFDVVLQDLWGPVYYCKIHKNWFFLFYMGVSKNRGKNLQIHGISIGFSIIFTIPKPISSCFCLNGRKCIFHRQSSASISSFKIRKLHPWHHGQLKGCMCWFMFKPLNLLRMYFSVQSEASLFCNFSTFEESTSILFLFTICLLFWRYPWHSRLLR